MRTFKSKIAIFVLFAVILGLSLALSPVRQGAEAKSDENLFSIKQAKSVIYCGTDYIDKNGNFTVFEKEPGQYSNDVFDAFSFFFDGVAATDVSMNNVRETTGTVVNTPGEYTLSFSIAYKDVSYLVKDVTVKVSKKSVRVYTYLNGTTDLTVKEGETISVAYGYMGALSEHTELKNTEYIPVTTIVRPYINSYAFVSEIPKQPTEKRTITAAYATSDYYDFVYESAYLTIESVTTNSLASKDEEDVEVTLMGTFSSICTVSGVNIGIDKTDANYASVYARAEARYKDDNFFDDYEAVACYSVDVYSDGESLSTSTPANVFIKTALSSDKKYKVMAFYKNGETEIVDAKVTSGVLQFYASDMGDFIVVTPIEGLSVTYYLVIIGGGIFVLLLFILLFNIFRRKR